jgi:hypothetical protein
LCEHYLNLFREWGNVVMEIIFLLIGDKGKKEKRNYLKYIEVVEDLICIQKQESAVAPEALSIQEFLSKTEV